MKTKCKLKVNWNIISSFGSIIAAIAAIIAIYFGNVQFNKSIERADQQIEILKNERKAKELENRPYISVARNLVAGLKDFKQYKLVIENIGYRPAINLDIKNQVISCNNELTEYNQIDSLSTQSSVPIIRNQSIDFVGNIYINDHKLYYIKLDINYLDAYLSKQYNETYYYKWTNNPDTNYSTSILYLIDRLEKTKIEGFFE